MSVAGKVKKIFGPLVEIKLPKKFSLKLSLLSHNKIVVNRETNEITIDLEKLDRKEKEALKKIIKEALSEEEYIIIETESQRVIEDIENKKGEFKSIKFFKDKLLSQDYNALEVGAYIKTLFKQGKDIKKYKWELIQKHGERGNTISKLYSEGYFEKLIRPLYEYMSQENGFSIEDFRKAFDKLINEFPFAIFVNRYMTDGDILKKINYKIEKNRRYGIKELNIHGIGFDNVRNIHKAVEELKRTEGIKLKDIREKDKIILVSIEIL